MTDIVDVLTLKECDRIARYKNCMVLKVKPEDGLTLPDVSNVQVGDWKFQWVGTKGHDQRGTLVLKPTNKRTKQLSVMGRIYHINRTYGVRVAMAHRIVRAMYGLRFVNSPEIMDVVVKYYDSDIWNKLPHPSKLTDDICRAFLERFSEDYPELKILSCAKLESVLQAIRRIRYTDPNLPLLKAVEVTDEDVCID
jgi:hypothetical protein